MPKKTVVLNGLYGVQNLGDDYILLSLVERLVSRFGSSLVVRVISHGGDLSFLEGYGDSVEVVVLPHGKVGHVLTAINEARRSDVFVIGGGGLWPFESKKQMALQSAVLHAAKAGGGHSLFFGVEVNPPKSDWYKKAWRKHLDMASLFVGRNAATAKSMRMLAPERASLIHGCADATFGLCDPQDKGGYRDGYILWALAMPWGLDELEDSRVCRRYDMLVSQIRKMILELSSVVDRQLLLPFYHDSDIHFLEDVTRGMESFAQVIGEDDLSLAQKRLLFKHASHAVVMRFHGVVFSLHEETPFTAIAYSPKITNLLAEAGLSDRYVKYGIRATDQFYEELDLDYDVLLKTIRDGLIDNDLKTRVRNASASCKTLAEEAYELLFAEIENAPCKTK